MTKKISAEIASKGIKTTGFYTEEVRKNRTREGFDVVALDGTRGRLARDLSLLSGCVKHKVGKYGVLIQEFENVAMPSLVKVKIFYDTILFMSHRGGHSGNHVLGGV